MALTKKQKEVLDYIYHYSSTHGYAPTQVEIQEHFNLKSLGSVQKYLKYLSNGGYVLLEANARRGIEILPAAKNLYLQIALESEPLPNTGTSQPSMKNLTPIPSSISLNADDLQLETSDNRRFQQKSPNFAEESNRFREIPLMGNVAAGLPIEGVKHFEFVDVPESFLKRERQYFALSVNGNSMIEDGIHDGDTIVLEQKNTALKGETIVAMIGSEATVKKFYQFSDRIELHPANSSMSPIVVKNEERGEFRIVGKLAALLRSY